MVREFLSSFLGGFGGVAVGFLVLKWLGAKLIETQLAKAIAIHQYELDKQLATLQGGMARLGDVLSRRNEREFAVTEKAWELLIEASGTALSELAGNPPAVIFGGMSEAQANEVIDSLDFTSTQKTALRAAVNLSERQRLYFEYAREHGYQRVRATWRELNNWLQSHQIFLNPPIYAAFAEIVDNIGASIATLPRAYDDPDSHSQMRVLAYRGLDDLGSKIDALAVLIRERFGFSEN